MGIRLTSVPAPHAPHLRLRLGVAAVVVLAAVPGVMAQRATTVVAVPSLHLGLTQQAR